MSDTAPATARRVLKTLNDRTDDNTKNYKNGLQRRNFWKFLA